MLIMWLLKPLQISLTHKWATVVLTVTLFVWGLLTNQFPAGVIGGLTVLLAADGLLGSFRAWRAGTLSFEGAFHGVKKALVYLSVVAVTNHLARIEMGSAWNLLTESLMALVSAMLLLTEAISVLQHVRAIGGIDVPVLNVLLRRLESEEKKLDDGGAR